jgi:hypothetical protein
MLFGYLRSKGKLPGTEQPTEQKATAPPPQPKRQPNTQDDLPIPGIQNVPGRENMTPQEQDILETFPADILNEGII